MLCCAALHCIALHHNCVCWLHADVCNVGAAHHVCNVSSNVQEMDSELERYHKSCAALELNIGEGSLKQAGLHKELSRQRSQTQDAHQAIRYAGDPHVQLPCSSSLYIILLHLDVGFRVSAVSLVNANLPNDVTALYSTSGTVNCNSAAWHGPIEPSTAQLSTTQHSTE